ncbi:DNA cytosine methyltransferase [Acanthopleuribacter pedis]|uniref:Cytosine-specific methyltransferase n=1 Tax=Acanthopleuribacter pedis TaxID=442870 RepID=A0A8J7Q3E2_9BACT|nr:DNA cytosine methyltransferase [Acanthopleuribacter pedis]MBO1316891.1 DNA cytosine methyltransferase [Acanthopleuribacter pedis]
MQKFQMIDLFSGAGGLTLGFHMNELKGSFESVLAIDNDQASINTYNGMFGERGICTDIEEWLRFNDVPKADLVVGGPPCQGFSLLNKKRMTDTRRALWEPYMDIVDQSDAKMFVMENVPDLLKSQEFLDIQKRAKDLGFTIHSQKLNSANYGAPQVRNRVIVVAYKTEFIDFIPFPPEKTHQKPQPNMTLPPWRVVEDAIGDLAPPVGTSIRNCEPPYDLHFGRNPTSVSRMRYKLIPEGGNRFDLQRKAPELTPQCWIRKKSGGTDLFGRLWRDRPSVTIRTEFFKPEKGRYLHPTQDRPITHREAARLMGFPDDFRFCGSKIEIARQIGNAVPPPFAHEIAKVVNSALKNATALV